MSAGAQRQQILTSQTSSAALVVFEGSTRFLVEINVVYSTPYSFLFQDSMLAAIHSAANPILPVSGLITIHTTNQAERVLSTVSMTRWKQMIFGVNDASCYLSKHR